jgi:hypothetical protein
LQRSEAYSKLTGIALSFSYALLCIFDQLFDLARYANLTKEERDMYNASLKYKWDNKNVRDYAAKKGIAITGQDTRTVAGITHTLLPNDNRYTWPIPDNEITLSNLPQNPR